jgi:hypothetical protein
LPPQRSRRFFTNQITAAQFSQEKTGLARVHHRLDCAAARRLLCVRIKSGKVASFS